jgi:hypothetical protein
VPVALTLLLLLLLMLPQHCACSLSEACLANAYKRGQAQVSPTFVAAAANPPCLFLGKGMSGKRVPSKPD